MILHHALLQKLGLIWPQGPPTFKTAISTINTTLGHQEAGHRLLMNSIPQHQTRPGRHHLPPCTSTPSMQHLWNKWPIFVWWVLEMAQSSSIRDSGDLGWGSEGRTEGLLGGVFSQDHHQSSFITICYYYSPVLIINGPLGCYSSHILNVRWVVFLWHSNLLTGTLPRYCYKGD